MEMSTQFDEAVRNRDLARQVFESKTPGTKAWREAAEDLDFWVGKVAFLGSAR